MWFSLGVGELHVGLEELFSPARKAHPALRVRDLPTMRARLLAAGCAVVEAEPIDDIERFYVSDPFGNRLELLERI